MIFTIHQFFSKEKIKKQFFDCGCENIQTLSQNIYVF